MDCTNCCCTKEGWLNLNMWQLQGYNQPGARDEPVSTPKSEELFAMLDEGKKIMKLDFSQAYKQLVLDLFIEDQLLVGLGQIQLHEFLAFIQP